MLDGCANRDPSFRIGIDYDLGASWSGQPLCLRYRLPSRSPDDGLTSFKVEDTTEFQIADIAFRGKSGERFFAVDRRSNSLHWQNSLTEHQSWIAHEFGLADTDFRPLGWWDAQPSDPFFPWNLIYYGIAPFVCFFVARKSIRRSAVLKPGSR
jgi:hypothetical protein